MRLWDIRLHSSIKLFRNPEIVKLTNCENDKESKLFVGAGLFVYSFDIRKEDIFVEKFEKKNE